MSSQTADPLIGRLVDGRYRVRARIARGGMATVYVATDLRLERRIALKVMHQHLSDDSVFQSRFIGEARAAARLADPNVVNVFDQGQDGELAYLVMEYLPGITLRDLMKEQRRLSIPHAITIMDAVLSGLSAAHRAGIVHRDVKPENVLLAEDGRIKIGDFGLARATTANTASGAQLMGTIAYLAPELVTRGTADARSDIYALGIMLYELLTGEQPFRGEQPMQIAFQHATESVPRPSVRNPGVPEQLDELVLWSTERDPEQRPTDAGVMLERLREIERELGVTPVTTAREATMTAGLAIPEDAHTSGSVTTIMPFEQSVVQPAAPVDTTDNATRLRKIAKVNRGKGGWLVTITALLAVLALVGGWYFGSGPGSQIAIPDFGTNTSEAEAMSALTELGLSPTAETEASLTVPSGFVTRTDPAAGARVDKESAITVYVSTGPAQAAFESFAGLSETDARKLLDAQFMQTGDTVYEFNPDVGSGAVVQVLVSPAAGGDAVDCTAGCSVHQGDPVQLVISKGDVPSVKGKPEAEARRILDEAGLSVAQDTSRVFSGDYAKDTVAWVDGPDGNWRVGDEVSLVLSAGAIPAVADLSESDARAKLQEAGLKVATENATDYSDTIAAGDVIGLQLADGASLRPGDTVTLIISLGPELFEVPDVSGMSLTDAVATIEDAGFVAKTNLPDILWGIATAAYTTPGAGEMVKKGTQITIVSSI